MNLFSPAPRELARILGRQAGRLRLLVAGWRLGKAETNLGLLGWQQADFGGDAQRHVEQLADVEREQAQLTNESARLGLALQRLQEECAAAQRQFEKARTALEAERATVAAPVGETARQVAERERMRENFAERSAVLERELGGANRRHADLLAAGTLTAETRGELGRLRGRTAGIPTELADLRLRQERLAQELRALEEPLARGRAAVAGQDEKLRAQRAEFEDADHARRKEVSDCEREKQTAEKKIGGLEKAKGNPYRKIGQALADSGIAPMNQPHALAAVEEGRAVVERLEQDLAASLEASAREDRAALHRSWWVWAAAGVVLVLIALVAK